MLFILFGASVFAEALICHTGQKILNIHVRLKKITINLESTCRQVCEATVRLTASRGTVNKMPNFPRTLDHRYFQMKLRRFLGALGPCPTLHVSALEKLK